MTRNGDPAERAALLWLMAAMHRTTAAYSNLRAAEANARAALATLTHAMAEADAADIANHPDLAYLGAQMRGFYDMPDASGKS